LRTEHKLPFIGKAVELLVMGLLVGLVSFALSYLWTAYEYKASDFIQYLSTEFKNSDFIQHHIPVRFREQCALTAPGGDHYCVPLIFIDIGEQTCKEWAEDYNNICAALPRLPHDELLKVFERLKASKPMLVIVDIDLRPEGKIKRFGKNPFDPDMDSFSPSERAIRDAVLSMKDTPFLVAQQLFRQPGENDPHQYTYAPIGTILHRLDRPNLLFGQVEQELDDDAVERRFPALLLVEYSDPILNPNSDHPEYFPHLAVRVCQFKSIRDLGWCSPKVKKDPDAGISAVTVPPKPNFGGVSVTTSDLIQFRYSLPRDVDGLVRLRVKQIEARSDFDPAALEDAIVIIGSTARGRGDYHFTPLDVFGGETAGVIVLANEVLAALQGARLEPPGFLATVSEKVILLLISTVIVFCMFWYFIIRRQSSKLRGYPRQVVCYSVVAIHFIGVVSLVILINTCFVVFISFDALGYGRLVDPVTPLVAAVLDAVMGLCAMISSKLSVLVERWRNPFAKFVS
jgi:CHASE2 domain-containing sensor protein